MVSFQPASVGKGFLPLRESTLKCTRCRWIGCAAGAALRCHTSVDPNSGLAAMRPGSNGSPLIPHIVLPLSATLVKRKLARAPGAGFGEPVELRYVRKTSRYRAEVVLFAGYAEAHYASGLALARAVLQRDLIANSVLREIYDHVEALRLRDAERAVSDRGAEQPPVAADLDERGMVCRLQGEFVAAGVGGVEDAKPVLRGRYLKYWSGSAVDQDGVSKDPVHVVVLDARFAL